MENQQPAEKLVTPEKVASLSTPDCNTISTPPRTTQQSEEKELKEEDE